MAQPNMFGVTEFDQDPATAVELMRLKRQQQIADAMYGQSQQPLQGGMVGQTYVAPSITQGLAKLMQGYVSGKSSEGVQEGYKGLADRKAQETANAIAAYKRGTMGTPEQPMGPPTEAGDMGIKPAFTPTPDARRQAIIEAAVSTNPRLSKMGQMDFQLDARKEDKQDTIKARMDELQFRLAEGRITKQEADARAADLRREMQEAGFAQQRSMAQLAAGLRQEPAPTVTEVIKDGKAVKVDARTGRVIGDSPAMGKGKAMSPTAQKELIQTDEEIQGGKAALTALDQAMKINDSAMGFKGAGAISSLGTLLPESIRPAAVDATENLDNILTAGALPQLKAIFGGMPTEGERKVLLEIQGSSSKSPAVRKQIFERAMEAATKRIEFSQKKAKALREGSYFAGDGGMETPAQPPTSSGLSAQEQAELDQLRARFGKK